MYEFTLCLLGFEVGFSLFSICFLACGFYLSYMCVHCAFSSGFICFCWVLCWVLVMLGVVLDFAPIRLQFGFYLGSSLGLGCVLFVFLLVSMWVLIGVWGFYVGFYLASM